MRPRDREVRIELDRLFEQWYRRKKFVPGVHIESTQKVLVGASIVGSLPAELLGFGWRKVQLQPLDNVVSDLVLNCYQLFVLRFEWEFGYYLPLIHINQLHRYSEAVSFFEERAGHQR